MKPVAKWTAIGSASRYFCQFASDYYLPLFYLSCYPTRRAEFTFMYALINIFCGLISSLAGGIISDRFAKGRPKLKANVCLIGNVLALPCLIGSLLTIDNFYLSMTFTGLRFLFGEAYRSPSITMIQNTTPPEKFGSSIGVF